MSLFTRNAPLAEYLSNSERSKGCIAYDPKAIAPTYGYVPNLVAGIVFAAVFFVSTILHIVQVARCRKWWYSSLALGALGECLGWAARAGAHHCSYNKTLFSLQISILIISPCFFSAAIYYILGQLINQYGRRYSFISPITYLSIFVSFDLVSIVIQAVGGGLASAAGGKSPPGNTKPGTHIMMAGIIIQLVSMSVFGLLWLIFLWRARAVPISRILILTTTFAAAMIIIRNFYRAIELSQGWKGYLITHEVYFAVLDGALMTLAVGTFNIFFPTRYVSGVPEDKTYSTDVSKSEA